MNEMRVFNLDCTKYVITNPELAFGSETWALKNTDMASSEAQQIEFFRRPVGVSRRDNLRNEVNPKWLCSQWGRPSLELLNSTLLTNSSFPHHIANLPWLGCG
jgi:hypothetical protein